VEQNATDAQPGESRWRGISIPVAIAALPLIIAAIRLYVFAGGDRQVLDAILAGVNLGTLWVALAAQFVPLLAMALPLFLFVVTAVWQSPRHLEARRSRLVNTRLVRWTVISFVLAVVLSGLFVDGWSAVLAPVSILAMGVGTHLSDRGMDRPDGESRTDFASRIAARRTYGARLSRKMAWIAYPLVLLVALFTGTIGLPIEFVRVESEPALSAGYVVGVDDTVLTLAYLDGGIRKIPTDEVKGRFVCPTHSPVGGLSSGPRSGVQVLFDATRSAQPYVAMALPSAPHAIP